MLAAGLVAIAVGVTALVREVTSYLDHPLAASSTSGVRVFRLPDGSLGGYEPFTLGSESILIGAGLVLVVAAVYVLAQTRSRTLASTAGSNADAQMR